MPANTSSQNKKYGRGTFQAHPEYIKYMSTIVENPIYIDMPNAVSNNRVNWQVSSGKTTSFYKFYLARYDWWVNKADSLKVKGTDNSDDRFSITARLVHPTGYRPCRLCGKDRNVGYFYLNFHFARTLNRLTDSDVFYKKMPIFEATTLLSEYLDNESIDKLMIELFPERRAFFEKYGYTTNAFERSNYLRSKYLSPGYMCNPPDRLDGFHDYCLMCREKNDPGRSKENLMSYTHDRRVFELWSEGDWLVADALYSKASAGVCHICNSVVDKISPDHVGPLSCGFKQMPLFMPTCQPCNSSKNRRMTAADVKILINYELSTNESVASWQVRSLWDANKALVATDADAKELSNMMRALQDLYIRVLHKIYISGYGGLLTNLLHPEYAWFKVEFINLDTSKLTYSSFKKTPYDSKLRMSLAARTVRIAFEELEIYTDKQIEDRKVRKYFYDSYYSSSQSILDHTLIHSDDARIQEWKTILSLTDKASRQDGILELLKSDFSNSTKYEEFNKKIHDYFQVIGAVDVITDL